ncbi:MAG: class IV adenylate cyclase, partial [Pirellulaceae bacterium]
LKLRQIDQCRGQLIWYQRADQAVARESYYQLIEIREVEAVCRLLSAALAVRSRVEKQRTVYWFENVRIHIDEVRALGTFIEFEAVISTPAERAAAADQLEFLSDALKINATDVLTMSYGDMVETRWAVGQLVTGGGLAGK